MNTTLALLALLSLATPATAAVVELAGYSVPSLFSAEVGLSLFAATFLRLIFSASYAPKAPTTVRGPRPMSSSRPSSPRGLRREVVRRSRPTTAAVLTR